MYSTRSTWVVPYAVPTCTGSCTVPVLDRSIYLDKTHIRFAALIVAETVQGTDDLKRLGERTHYARTISREYKSEGVWEAMLLDHITGKELLGVTRNLTCSEKGAFEYNQTLNTSWNCLTSRRVNGVENKAPSLLEVNGVNLSPFPIVKKGYTA